MKSICRIPGCGRNRGSRSGLCRRHARVRLYYGDVSTKGPVLDGADQKALRREACRLLTVYGNRAATHEALRLAERVYTFTPSHNWTRFTRVQEEAERLRSRADPKEVLTRTLTAYLALQSPHYCFPTPLAEAQHIGRVVLSPVRRVDDNGRRYVLMGRVVSDFGEHVRSLLGVFCLGLIRKAEADEAARRAAVSRSLNFDEVVPNA